MIKRSVDIALALLALSVLWPLFLLAAIGIRLSSPGPVLYRARRVGRNGREFAMYKFRTMRPGDGGPRITAADDARIFPVGGLLRRTKVDELPQLVNVVRGEMSLVGPRPEDPTIVRELYTASDLETLRVAPGLASPGSIYNYTHGESALAGASAERRYADELLPTKLALDLVYVRRKSALYDARIVARTIWVLACFAAGRRQFAEPPEMTEATEMLSQLPRVSTDGSVVRNPMLPSSPISESDGIQSCR